ncbi:MAG: triose-phosphate isomerase [Candidatus Kuenenia sp.]|nr:triose-phosphate isomerase [Candidatus Kuenenia hertensis]
MNKSLQDGVQYARSLKAVVDRKNEIVCGICPPYVFLKDICAALEGSAVCVAAQNMHSQSNGAFTGEVAAPMLKEVGCSHVLIGHSERRHIFGEDDFFINEKVKKAISFELVPILCIGETLEERETGNTKDVVLRQLKNGLLSIDTEILESVILAYEPVWAIGTGRTALPEQANEVHSFIRTSLSEDYGENVAKKLSILYGGSVKAENTRALIKQPEIDGLLVGGASLELESFLKIFEVVLGC